MNFDQSLRAAMPAASEPATLTSAIDLQISRRSAARSIRLRLAWSVAAALASASVFFAMPTLSAQASLNRISGALDGVDYVVSKEYTLDQRGNRTLSGVIAYDHGKWRLERSAGKEITIFTMGRRFTYEPYTKSYIVENSDGPFAHNSGLRLSSILKDMSAWQNNVELRTSSLNGQPVVEATITNRDLPERTTIIADAKTSLPILGFADARENGVWRRAVEFQFDYASPTAAANFVPDPKIPQVSKSDWLQQVIGTMLAKSVARFPTTNGGLCIRSLDVAEDGSVFVSFQAGKSHGGWTGYAFHVADDLGSTYAQIQMVGQSESPFRNILRKDGGPIEFAVFVPTSPAKTWTPRSITLTAHIDEHGNFVRLIQMGVTHPDGHIDWKWIVNSFGKESQNYTDVPIVSQKFDIPSSTDRPEFMTVADPGQWTTSTVSDLSKARARAKFFLEAKDSRHAEFWLQKEFQLMDQIQSEGGPSYSRDWATQHLESLKSIHR